MEESQYCEDCKKIVDESTIEEFNECEMCGHLYKGEECTCMIEDREHNIQKESAERIRYLMSLGHPCEHGEVYTRWQIMDECQRRGKQLFIDLGWPITPEAIYKNKYTGTEATLQHDLYKFCMEKEQQEPFNIRLDNHGWSIIEHSWPKNLWTDTDMFTEYKGKLSYFKDKEEEMKPNWSITETSAEDDMEDMDDTFDMGEDSGMEDYVEQSDNVVRGKKKQPDKAQAKLGAW